VHKPIDFGSGDTGPHVLSDVIHELGVELAGSTHSISLLLGELKFAEILKHCRGCTLGSVTSGPVRIPWMMKGYRNRVDSMARYSFLFPMNLNKKSGKIKRSPSVTHARTAILRKARSFDAK
jgi:hypothetical protein